MKYYTVGYVIIAAITFMGALWLAACLADVERQSAALHTTHQPIDAGYFDWEAYCNQHYTGEDITKCEGNCYLTVECKGDTDGKVN